MGKMGDRLMLHPTSVTNIIDRLEHQDLVRRIPHPTDRRTVLAQITEEGRQVAEKATEAVSSIRFGVDGLSVAELDQLTDMVRKLRIAAGDFPG
jgi:DNA-binding MarR family transcriptional regulator